MPRPKVVIAREIIDALGEHRQSHADAVSPREQRQPNHDDAAAVAAVQRIIATKNNLDALFAEFQGA